MTGPHPQPDRLLGFLAGEATGAERRAIVRHLLTGCRECTAVTRPVWLLAGRLTRTVLGPSRPQRREEEMTIDLQAAGERLGAVVGELGGIRSRLLDLEAGLPLSPAETSEDDLDAGPNPSAELRAVIECGVKDCLDPLIRYFSAAAKRARR